MGPLHYSFVMFASSVSNPSRDSLSIKASKYSPGGYRIVFYTEKQRSSMC